MRPDPFCGDDDPKGRALVAELDDLDDESTLAFLFRQSLAAGSDRPTDTPPGPDETFMET